MTCLNARKFARRIAAAALVIVGGASVASAGTSSVVFSAGEASSVKHRGAFSGTATFDDASDLLTVTITNTTASGKGFLTGFAFDLKGAATAKYEDANGKKGFNNTSKHGIRLKPYGKFEEGVALHGMTRHGIAAGASRTFVFDVKGATADEQAIDLLTNPNGLSIVADFKGFRHGRRDRAGATLSLPSTSILPGDQSAPSTTGTTVTPAIVDNGGDQGGLGIPASGGGSIGLPTGGLGGTSGGSVAAVPLPSAAWSGLGMIGLLAAAGVRRKMTPAIA